MAGRDRDLSGIQKFARLAGSTEAAQRAEDRSNGRGSAQEPWRRAGIGKGCSERVTEIEPLKVLLAQSGISVAD
jgi:hypothetical protein